MAGAGVLSNMCHVESFLCFIKLRGGTLFSLYVTFVLSLLGILTSINIKFPFNISLLVVSIVNVLVSSSALLYFPGMNKKYNENSANANCIKYFSISNGVMVVLGFLPMSIYALQKGRHRDDTFIGLVFFTIIWTAVFAHFASVSYSFYLSVLQSENEHRGDLATNKIVNKATEKNINFNNSSDRKNDTKIDIPLQPMDSSTNGSGNLYVELR